MFDDCMWILSVSTNISTNMTRDAGRRELELSHIPERRSVVQAGNDILHAGPRVAILQPTQLDNPPQLVAEPEAHRSLRFLWSNPLHDRIDDQNVRRNLEEGVVSAQNLQYIIRQPFATMNPLTRTPTS